MAVVSNLTSGTLEFHLGRTDSESKTPILEKCDLSEAKLFL